MRFTASEDGITELSGGDLYLVRGTPAYELLLNVAAGPARRLVVESIMIAVLLRSSNSIFQQLHVDTAMTQSP